VLNYNTGYAFNSFFETNMVPGMW